MFADLAIIVRGFKEHFSEVFGGEDELRKKIEKSVNRGLGTPEENLSELNALIERFTEMTLVGNMEGKTEKEVSDLETLVAEFINKVAQAQEQSTERGEE